MRRKIYTAGHCLTLGAQMQRKQEAGELRELGHELFNPLEAAHNNKAEATQEGLAERIVRNDTKAIMWSDTVVIEPLAEATGTCVELGQLLGLHDLSKEILKIIDEDDGNAVHSRLTLETIYELATKQLERKVYPHFEDIRLNAPTGDGYRSTIGVNAYVTGACIRLSNNKEAAPDGFYQWNQILEELKK